MHASAWVGRVQPGGARRGRRTGALIGLRIATWNVNSVRLRLDGVRRLIGERAPDVICLQETKAADGDFPAEFFEEFGYRHRVLYGQKTWHGVAICSRLPLSEPGSRRWWGKEEARHVHAVLPGGVELHNVYVPAGGDIPDPEANDKFRHKLGFIEEMTEWFATRDRARLVLAGDLNVAPLDTDVWSHKQLLTVVSHTPVEVAALGRLAAARGFLDAVRRFIPPELRLYTWWSYRARDWAASDRGRRLDHLWVSPDLGPGLRGAEVLRGARGWPQPSDHVPVVLDLAV